MQTPKKAKKKGKLCLSSERFAKPSGTELAAWLHPTLPCSGFTSLQAEVGGDGGGVFSTVCTAAVMY